MQTASVRVVTGGLPDRLTAQLRSGRREVRPASSTDEALSLLRRAPGGRALVLSELFPGAGDLLAAVEADYVLEVRTLIAIVGDRTALAIALRRRGVPVVSIRGAGKRLDILLGDSARGLHRTPGRVHSRVRG